MISLANEARAKKVWFDDENLWVLFYDGRNLSIPLVFFPRLSRATKEQRNQFTMSGGGLGLHWEEIDEDISVPGLLLGIPDQTKRNKMQTAS